MKNGKRQAPTIDLPDSPVDLLSRIVAECDDPARLIELFYWSAEPELAEVMRNYIALPEDVRAILHAFLALAAHEPGSVTVRTVRAGEMTLSTPATTKLAERIAHHQVAPATRTH